MTLFDRLINHVRDTYVTVRQFNARPRPRCIALGFTEQGFAVLEQVLPGVVRISSLDDVHQSEWDLLVAANGDLIDVESHLYVIAFGCRIIGKIHADDAVLLVRTYEIDEEEGPGRSASVAVEFSTPDSIPPRFVALVADDLVPRLKAEHRHDTLVAYRPSGGDVGKPSYEVPGVERMLVGSDSAVYAAHFKRPGGKSWFLTLPDEANVVAWVEAAVSHWHGVDGKRFPGTLDWALERDRPDDGESKGIRASVERRRDDLGVVLGDAFDRLGEVEAITGDEPGAGSVTRSRGRVKPADSRTASSRSSATRRCS